MRSTTERELKLAGGAGFRFSRLPGEPIADRTFVSTYHDTPGLSLAGSGITLRHRVEGRSRLWQMKLPRADVRVELEVEGNGSAVPAEIASLLVAHLRHGPLTPIAALRTERTGVVLRDRADAVVEVVRDSVLVLEGDDATGRRFEELELELLEGDRQALLRVEQLLRGAGARDGDGRPKLFRALDLRAAAPPPAAAADARGRLSAALQEHYRALLANDPGTRLGADPEHLHRHRVAVRRLRAILRAARPILEAAPTERLRDELRTLGAALGPVRDHDVLLGHLRPSVEVLGEPDSAAAEPLLHAIAVDREIARDELLGVLADAGYLMLLDRLERFAAGPPATDPTLALAQLAGSEFRKLARALPRLSLHPSDAELHALRIRVKRVRYAAELADDGRRRWQRLIDASKRAQDVLGEHQDAHVAEVRLRQLSVPRGPARIAAGRLIERERRRRARARAAYPALMAELERAGRGAL